MTEHVSVIVPCYNAAPWLAETLNSLAAQTVNSLEVILVDDGSKDQSLAIARSAKLPTLKIIEQANAGAAAARNRGLQVATGDFIQFLDADDCLAPEKIARQLDMLRQSPARSVASGPWGRFETSPDDARFIEEENWRISDPIEWLQFAFAGRGMMPPAAWLVPRQVADAAGPWDESLTLNDDGEYFCRILLAASSVQFCPDAMCYYRSNIPGSLSRSHSSTAWDSAWRSQQASINHLRQRADTPESRQAGADLMQRLAYAAHPDAPEISRRAEAAARDLGGSKLKPDGGRPFRLLCHLLGWRRARKWQARRQHAQS